MKQNLVAACILALVLAGGVDGMASAAQNAPHYLQTHLKRLLREAQTPEQFNVLADYFAKQQKSYLQKAEEEKQEWVRRIQNSAGGAANYPRHIDSARNLYEYQMFKASEAGTLSAKYAQLAAPAKVN